MNKRLIDEMLPVAYRLLSERGIAKDGYIGRTMRSSITAYSAEIVLGTPLSATASMLDEGEQMTPISNAVYMLLMQFKEGVEIKAETEAARDSLFRYISEKNTLETKEMLLHCLCALRMAMGLYLYEEGEDEPEDEVEQF